MGYDPPGMLLRAVPDRALDDILSGVSRSFYLSLSILPRALRTQLSVAYLVARAADTIADTRVVRAERRLELLTGLRGALTHGDQVIPLVGDVRREIGAAGPGDGASEAEHVLLERLGDCLRALHAFEAGDRAVHEGKLYEALWWTRNQEPGSPTGPWQEMAETESGIPIWTPSRVFNAGDVVFHNGLLYRAQWWNRNVVPTGTGAWRLFE